MGQKTGSHSLESEKEDVEHTNKKLKQRRRWRQQERQKCKSLDKQNNNSARAAHIFVQFPSLHEYDVNFNHPELY